MIYIFRIIIQDLRIFHLNRDEVWHCLLQWRNILWGDHIRMDSESINGRWQLNCAQFLELAAYVCVCVCYGYDFSFIVVVIDALSWYMVFLFRFDFYFFSHVLLALTALHTFRTCILNAVFDIFSLIKSKIKRNLRNIVKVCPSSSFHLLTIYSSSYFVRYTRVHPIYSWIPNY